VTWLGVPERTFQDVPAPSHKTPVPGATTPTEGALAPARSSVRSPVPAATTAALRLAASS